MPAYICAVDVGTRSARAGIFNPSGTQLARSTADFEVYERAPASAEYRFSEIWAAVCDATSSAIALSGIDPETVVGLALDATCSLVLMDRAGQPLALTPDGQDTIAWFDHRAVDQAVACTRTRHPLLDHLGGTMSPEMQTPKLMWLKHHRPDVWAQTGQTCDLADALVARAIGTATRSASTIGAKWPFLPARGGWQRDFLTQIGLDDLATHTLLPDTVSPVGSCVGRVSATSARALGLAPGTRVAAGMIDAYAGALTAFATCTDADHHADAGRHCTALITGTSGTIIDSARAQGFAPGIWGPFRDVVVPGFWTREGGQSAAGAVLDHLLTLWPDHTASHPRTHAAIFSRISELLKRHGPGFAAGLRVLPDFNGNRSPFADPAARGMISGLTLDHSFDALCALYWRTAVSLALGTRQILNHMAAHGEIGATLVAVGGFSRSPLLMQLYADATNRILRVPHSVDGILLGSAIAASVAAGLHADLQSAAVSMACSFHEIRPNPQAQARFNREYRAFELMQSHARALAQLI